MRHIDYIAIHCSATKGDVSAKTIDSWHRERGWTSIGYHYVIRTSGEIETGRKLEETGAHVKGYNQNSIGICLTGGLDENNQPADTFTDAQYHSLQALLTPMKLAFPNAIIQGHRDFPNVVKECPCFNVRHWLNKVGLI